MSGFHKISVQIFIFTILCAFEKLCDNFLIPTCLASPSVPILLEQPVSSCTYVDTLHSERTSLLCPYER